MKVGILAQALSPISTLRPIETIGFEIAAVYNRTAARGQKFAQQWGAEIVLDYRDLCRLRRARFRGCLHVPRFSM